MKMYMYISVSSLHILVHSAANKLMSFPTQNNVVICQIEERRNVQINLIPDVENNKPATFPH